jgi:hypothetical protein
MPDSQGESAAMIGRVYLERGRAVLLLKRWDGPGPRNVLVERGTGERVVRPFRGLRRSPAGDGRVGPHEGREIELLLAGTKPAAIVDDLAHLAQPLAGLPFASDGDDLLVGRDHATLERLREAVSSGSAAAIGRALGYSNADVLAYMLWVGEIEQCHA